MPICLVTLYPLVGSYCLALKGERVAPLFIAADTSVSGYLQSYFGLNDTNQSINPGGDEMQQDYRVATDSLADIAQKENDQRQSNQHDKEVTLLGIDNLAEVQVRDLFECHKCEMTFDEKDTYLQHLLSFHQRTTRRYRLGSSVGDGVIIKDGKFECQFCHKVFHERRRYNGHVGIHVRNYVRGIEEPHGRLTLQKRTESPIRDEFPTRISKMDALIEIAQNSILETSTGGPNNEPVGGSAPDKLNVVSNSELLASFSDHELTSDNSFTEPEIDDAKFDTNMDELSDQQIIENMVTTEKMKKIDDAGCLMDVKVEACVDTGTSIPADEQKGCKSEASDGKDGLVFIAEKIDKSVIERESGAESCSLAPSINQNGCPVESNVNLGCLNTVEPGEPDEVNNNKNIRVEACSGSSNVEPADEKLSAAVEENLKENLLQYGVSETSMSLLEPSHGFPTTNAVSNKVEDEAHRIEQRHPNVTGFDDLRLDEIESMKSSFGTGQESGPLPEAPIQMSNNAGMDGSYGSSTQVESEVLLNSTSGHHLTTLCVWCGMEFSHEVVDSEMQPDSVGYMCPTCKAKISGQLGGMGSS
ncbi:methyl-CpG-binding domain-containing protein 8 [Citrus sinensis]|nr:methyl-CpG-binding domain-containing protein 8 [Citrus sinensis]